MNQRRRSAESTVCCDGCQGAVQTIDRFTMAVWHAADDWIEIDEHYVQELDERNKLLHANKDRVVGCIPEVSSVPALDSSFGASCSKINSSFASHACWSLLPWGLWHLSIHKCTAKFKAGGPGLRKADSHTWRCLPCSIALSQFCTVYLCSSLKACFTIGC